MKKSIVSLIILCAFTTLYMTSCSNEEDGGNNRNIGASVEHIVTFTGGGERRTTNEKILGVTRTSISYTQGKNATALWSTGDKIWVKDNAGNFIQSTAGVFSSDLKLGKFTLSGLFPTTTQVSYTGRSGTSGTTVTISANQTQSAANDFSHVGEVGDCGIATAMASSYGNYAFTLDHKSTYLCLLPRSTNNLIRDFVIQDVTIIADHDISGDFTLSASGLSANAVANGSKSIKVTVPNLPLANATNASANAIYVVMAPQTTALNIVYHLYNPALNFSGTITKNIAVQTYNAGEIHDITANLGNDYTEEQKPYFWDAKKWLYDGQAEPYNMSAYSYPANPMWPQSKTVDPDRWFNDENPAVAKNSCKDCPTGYQMTWYITHYPYFDAEELWTAEGKLYKGVLRMRKWNTLVADFGASKTAVPTSVPSGNAWEAYPGVPNANNFGIDMGIPTPSDMTKYFALPAAYSSVAVQKDSRAGKYANIVDDYNSYWASTTRTDGRLYHGNLSACYLTCRPGENYLWVSSGDYIERERGSARFAVKFQ